MKKVALIMAGGSGTRFWPLSTKDKPKQFLKLISDKTMLEQTIDRVALVTEKENIYIVTSKKYSKIINEILPDFTNIIIEPMAKDTAACIGYSVMNILKKYKEDVIVSIYPSDHLIEDMDKFKNYVKKAYDIADNGYIVTMGIKPTYPETAYGYIEYRGEDVLAFREKPNIDIAERYFESKNYLWNSGMFFVKASVMLDEIKRYLPEHYYLLSDDKFEQLNPVSIDIAVMEKTKIAKVIAVDFKWNDVGSFNSLEKVFDKDDTGSIVRGDTKYVSLNSSKNIVINEQEGKIIAVVGIDDLIIVNTEDKLLICPREKGQEIKKISGLINE
ncbi:mannose-1-phosphate guanylyltransferase [Caviibacter abscessus]|uniref:mannose-1-phosphate guanylyltransferase n=1 Tax=Caviibacter abscessus TaxID=1766719 RepID=UPI0008385445|nr:sugar phosphate nucleotidyltransferase [Caviibacter abscessus]